LQQLKNRKYVRIASLCRHMKMARKTLVSSLSYNRLLYWRREMQLLTQKIH